MIFHCRFYFCSFFLLGYITQDVENAGSTVSDDGCWFTFPLGVSIRMTKERPPFEPASLYSKFFAWTLIPHLCEESSNRRWARAFAERNSFTTWPFQLRSSRVGQDRTKDLRWTLLALYSHSAWPILLYLICRAGSVQGHRFFESETATPSTIQQHYTTTRVVLPIP